MKQETLTYLKRECERYITAGSGAVTSFTEELRKNPRYAFQWACEQTLFASVKASCASEVLDSLQDAVKKGEPELDRLEFLRVEYQKEVNRSAAYPIRSTSPMASLIQQAELKAHADLLEIMNACRSSSMQCSRARQRSTKAH